MTAEPYSATMATVRRFNPAGPVVAADHHCIPPPGRVDLKAVPGLIRDRKYFALHAPRQTPVEETLADLCAGVPRR